MINIKIHDYLDLKTKLYIIANVEVVLEVQLKKKKKTK